MPNCLGLYPEEGGFFCPARPDAYPEDGDWETFCRACEASQQLADDRAVDWQIERTGALE